MFEGKRGVAYAGPTSPRNLRVLARLRASRAAREVPALLVPRSATATSLGRMAAEYLLRGAGTFQMHTFFQLPNARYRMSRGGRTERALHELYFNPERGLLACVLRLRRALDWPEGWNVKRMADFCADPANRLWAAAEPAAVRA